MRSSSYRWGCDWALNAHRGDGAIAFCTLPSRWSARRPPHQSQDFKRKLKTKWYLKKIVIIKEGKREARGDRTKRCAKAEDSACLARQEERRRTLGSGRASGGPTSALRRAPSTYWRPAQSGSPVRSRAARRSRSPPPAALPARHDGGGSNSLFPSPPLRFPPRSGNSAARPPPLFAATPPRSPPCCTHAPQFSRHRRRAAAEHPGICSARAALGGSCSPSWGRGGSQGVRQGGSHACGGPVIK